MKRTDNQQYPGWVFTVHDKIPFVRHDEKEFKA
jgi:hypothetical protein